MKRDGIEAGEEKKEKLKGGEREKKKKKKERGKSEEKKKKSGAPSSRWIGGDLTLGDVSLWPEFRESLRAFLI